MEKRVKQLLSALDWNRTKEEQQAAIQELLIYKDILFEFIITLTEKCQWANAIRYISMLNVTDQMKYVPQMMLLLKDMNWPGALEATILMAKLNQKELKEHIIEALEKANIEKDTIWIAHLKNFIINIGLDELLIEYKEIINKAEW